jgi:hypothetical protein
MLDGPLRTHPSLPRATNTGLFPTAKTAKDLSATESMENNSKQREKYKNVVPARDTKAPDKIGQQTMAQRIPVRRTLPQTQDQFQGNIPDGSQLIDQSTPTRKTAERPRNGPEEYNRPPSCLPNLPVTPRQGRPYQTGPELQIAPLQYDPEVTTQSSPPQTPTCEEENFFTQGNSHMVHGNRLGRR